MGERFLLSTVAGLLARVIEAEGREEEAEAFTRRVEEVAADDDPVEQASWRSVRARILARRGEHELAIRLANEAVALRRQSDSPMLMAEVLVDLAEVLRHAGDEAAAEAARSEAVSLYESKGDVVSAARLGAEIATPA